MVGGAAGRQGPGPMLRSVLVALRERGFEVGADDDGRRMSVDGGRDRRAWLAYGRVMHFESDPGSGEAFASELNALLAALPDEFARTAGLPWASPTRISRGSSNGSASRRRAYVLAVEAGLRDLHSIVARYGLPGPP